MPKLLPRGSGQRPYSTGLNGRYWSGYVLGGQVSLSLAYNLVMATPIVSRERFYVTKIAVYLTENIFPDPVRYVVLGMYRESQTERQYPGARIFSSGEFNDYTEGLKEYTLPSPFWIDPYELYYVAYFGTSPRGLGPEYLRTPMCLMANSSGIWAYSGFSVPKTYDGVLPDPYPSDGYPFDSNSVPLIR